MIQWVKSPALGWVRVYDGPTEPVLAPWLPAFHVDELKVLRKAKAQTWRDVAMAKSVFPGAVATESYNVQELRDRRMRQWARNSLRRGYTPPSTPEPTEDDESPGTTDD